MRKLSFASQLVICPYAEPAPRQYIPCGNQNIVEYENLKTLFSSEENRNVTARKRQAYMNTLNQNLTSMEQLQFKFSNDEDDLVYYIGNASRFLNSLTNPNISIYKIQNLPSLRDLKFDSFLSFIIDKNVPVLKACWGIGLYLKQVNSNKIQDDCINLMLIKYLYLNMSKRRYFIILMHELCHKGIIHKNGFLEWLVTNEGDEMILEVFKDDICDSFNMVKLFLKKGKSKINLINYLKKGQVIQFAIKNDFLDKIMGKIDMFDYKRIREIRNVLRNENIICYLKKWIVYNNDDQESLKKVEKYLLFFDEDQKEDFFFEMLVLLEIHNLRLRTVSVIVLCLKSLNIFFSLSRFIEFLYQNIPNISCYTELFFELQINGLINYSSFLDFIREKRYEITKSHETLEIILNMPLYDRSKSNLDDVNYLVNLLQPINDYKEKVQQLYSDPLKKKYSSLPSLYLYQYGLSIIENKKFMPSDIYKIFISLKLQTLIPFIKFENEAIIDNLPIVNELKTLFFLRNQSSEIKETQDFHPELAKKLFFKYSYLCDLSLYDAIINIKDKNDFIWFLNQFIKRSISFISINPVILFYFFIDLSCSNILPNIYGIFNSIIYNILLENELNENISLIIFTYFAKMFENNFILISKILSLVLENSKLKQETNASLLEIIINITKQNKLNFDSILTQELLEKHYNNISTFKTTIINSVFNINNQTITNIENSFDYGVLLFSTLPIGLFNADLNQFLSFLVDKLNHENVSFWSLWIKYRLKFQYIYPLYLNNNNVSEKVYYFELTKYLMKIKNELLIIEVFEVLCSNQYISNILISFFTVCTNKIVSFGILKPILKHLSYEVFESFCISLINSNNVHYDDILISSTLIFFVKRFKKDGDLEIFSNFGIYLLEKISKLFEKESLNFEFVLDCYNYLIASLNERNYDFHKHFNEKIKKMYNSLEEIIKTHLLINN